jgi:hypothetical protein
MTGTAAGPPVALDAHAAASVPSCLLTTRFVAPTRFRSGEYGEIFGWSDFGDFAVPYGAALAVAQEMAEEIGSLMSGSSRYERFPHCRISLSAPSLRHYCAELTIWLRVMTFRYHFQLMTDEKGALIECCLYCALQFFISF